MLNFRRAVAVPFGPDLAERLPQFEHLFACGLSYLTNGIDVLPRWRFW
jgi:hypothetical protein